QHLAVFSLSGLILFNFMPTVVSGPAVPSGLVISCVKASQLLCLNKCPLDIQGYIQPAWARAAGPGQI
ncbi:hypothetical protein, partial [Eggerthella lenta]|uniref:hypothetical protein n=1 Tax=Eggerthella lenta TaxID=84112 RepID=UPI001D082253